MSRNPYRRHGVKYFFKIYYFFTPHKPRHINVCKISRKKFKIIFKNINSKSTKKEPPVKVAVFEKEWLSLKKGGFFALCS